MNTQQILETLETSKAMFDMASANVAKVIKELKGDKPVKKQDNKVLLAIAKRNKNILK